MDESETYICKKQHFSNIFESRLGKQKGNLSVDQLSQALELTKESETSQEEKKILKGIVSFGNIDAREVMRPRLDVVAIAYDQSFKDLLLHIKTEGYSRIPVYKEDIDNIEGILYIRKTPSFTSIKHKSTGNESPKL